MQAASLLIVEDDAALAQQMAERLTAWAYRCRTVQDFGNVLGEFAQSGAQLVILDVSLPLFDGYYWCAQIRKISKVPIIFVSAAADEMNIVMAVNMGADDFIVKPFDFSVLAAKVQALLRRTYDFGAPQALLSCGNVTLCVSDGTATVDGQRVRLSRNEQRILQVLFENRGQTVPRALLMQRLWETDLYVDENTLTVNVTRLRRKLAQAGAPALIETRKGEGYLVR